jgi:AraC family transcriptional activator of tynA and feaB
MKTLFTTVGVHPRDRFDCWHSAARQYVVDHDAHPDCRLAFEAQLRSAPVGDLQLIAFESSPMTVVHDARHIAQLGADELLICRPLTGALSVEQDSRQAALHPGDMTLLDPRLPYRGRFSPSTSLLVLKVPRRHLEARVGRTRDMIARAMRPADGDNAIASDYLALLTLHAERLGRTSTLVAEQALDLMSAALAGAMGAVSSRVSATRSALRFRLHSLIEGRLADPTLNAYSVARAAGVSVRYANAVLADTDTSIVRLIQTHRLERCRRALSDRAQAHRSIREIAYCWGFSDMTHFGRRFKAAYGVLPSEYRNAR